MERGALQDAFLQEYDPGFLLWDNELEEQVWWGTGIYRIDAEETGLDFGDGEYAWTSRLCYLLWDNPEHRYLMHVGASYSLRSSEFDPTTATSIVRFRARPEVRSTPRLVDTGSIACDNVDLVGAETAWVHGPLSVQGEYMLAHVDNGTSVPGGPALGDVDLHGYYVFFSYFLTGEHRPYDPAVAAFGRIKPYENFFRVRTADGVCGGRGAWELAARYSNVDLVNGNLNGGNLDQITLGVNWYWNPNMRLMFNYIWTDRDILAPNQEGELNTFAMRASLDF
jgi:phosphate-selective porin OprO/OprP